MGDVTLRRAQRDGDGSDLEAEVRLLAKSMRAGEVPPPLVELHGELGDLVACGVLGISPDRGPNEDRVRELCSDPSYGLAYDDPICGRMCYVPDGVSVLGSAEDDDDEAWDDEKPQMLVFVPAYWIAQRPVTLAQWRAHRSDDLPEGEGVRGDRGPDQAPVVRVSWNDCQKWLDQLPEDGKSASLRVLRGGSWYVAARNCRSANRNWSSPGCRNLDLGFRPARSVEGGRRRARVLRGGGWLNTARFCRSADRFRLVPGLRNNGLGFRPARSVEGDGASKRVHRGGSWYDSARICRSAYRYRDVPGIRYSDLGFRPTSDTGRLRLPTEDEWERAARGWDARKYPWGEEWESREERQGLQSPWGLYDMGGEVWQWCQDAWNGNRHLPN